MVIARSSRVRPGVDSDGDSDMAILSRPTACLRPDGYVTNQPTATTGVPVLTRVQLRSAMAPMSTRTVTLLADDDDATVSSGSKSTFYYDEDGDGYGGDDHADACDPRLAMLLWAVTVMKKTPLSILRPGLQMVMATISVQEQSRTPSVLHLGRAMRL